MEDVTCDASSVSYVHTCQGAMATDSSGWATTQTTFPQWLQAILPGTRLVSYIDVHHWCKSGSQCQKFTINFHNRTTVVQEVTIAHTKQSYLQNKYNDNKLLSRNPKLAQRDFLHKFVCMVPIKIPIFSDLYLSNQKCCF